jgi:hypothetical protein
MATQPTIKLCLERPIPGFELAVANKNYWPADRKILRVRLMGGAARMRSLVQKYAEAWHPYISLRFEFVDDPQAEIRVAFNPNGRSWSALGTDALNKIWFPQETMNFGWLDDGTDEEEYSRVVTHEFGHALGCIHEHQSPAADIPWDKAAVYRYYAESQGWSQADVDQNIFRHWDGSLHSTFDKESIMLYAVPKELTVGGYEVGWNRRLSATDKSFIATVYPPQVPKG